MTRPQRGITKENAVELGRKGAAAKAAAVRARHARKAEEEAALAKATSVLLAAPSGAPSPDLLQLAGQIVEGIGHRILREIDTYPPSTLASLASTFHAIKRLEGGQSTSNVAHAGLSPADRRARILELAKQLGRQDEFLVAEAGGPQVPNDPPPL